MASVSNTTGVCGWTTSESLCLWTVVPIGIVLTALLLFLVYGFYITPQRSALEETLPPAVSPLIPDSMKHMEPQQLQSILGAVDEVPLKTFLPRLGLEELVEPCAVMGVASVRDMLRINRLALRDIGMGPKEQRLFTRGLERRIKLRSQMHQVLVESIGASHRERGPTFLRQGSKTRGATPAS